jgi:4-hydroxybenzoate polyprenyltransferase/phosphoserine phosphatase
MTASRQRDRDAFPDPPVPLAVDLDGTLVSTDLLVESVLLLARKRPLGLLQLPLWLRQGKAHLKRRIAEEVVPDVDALPYNADLIARLEEERRRGRTLVLATASDGIVARAVAGKLGLFDAVLASDGVTNLRGEQKRAALVEAYGDKGFDYAANSRRDIPVWRSARRALLVHPAHGLSSAVAGLAEVDTVYERTGSTFRALVETVRPHHWLKNMLVFVPLAASHDLLDMTLIMQVLLAFISFSLCASSVYVINDLLDLPSDRHHPHKKDRVLASGRLPLLHAAGLIPLLLLCSAGIGLLLPPAFLGILAFYFVLMLAYSQRLKDVAILDVLVLSSGYTLRVVAGAAAIRIEPSIWLMTFCGFLFFSLALTKRYAELVTMRGVEGKEAHARAYLLEDAELIAALGVASGHVAALVLALYVNSTIARNFYSRPELIWLACGLLLYWISYLWLMAHRGRLHDDPLVFAVRNRTSLALMILMAVILMVAI